MNAQELANALLQFIPKVNIPATPENAQGVLQIYRALGQMARGELILVEQKSCHHGADCSCHETDE